MNPLRDITNLEENIIVTTAETPRQGEKQKNTTFAPKKSGIIEQNQNNLVSTGRKLQFEDENSLQSISKQTKGDRNGPPDIHDRGKCLRKKYPSEQVFFSDLFDLIPLGFNSTKENSTSLWCKYNC